MRLAPLLVEQESAHYGKRMKPLVKDWVQTLGMSRSLARSLRLPLDLPLEEFLEDLPEEQKDEVVEQKLHRFLSKRDDEAMVHDPAVHRRERVS